jgi:long-chain acyl-CoA synthetase
MDDPPSSSSELAAAVAALPGRFRPGAVDRTTTYYLTLGPAPGNRWTVTGGPTSCQIVAGKPAQADCVLKTTAELFLRLLAGQWKPGPMDFLAGRIKTNDIELLRGLQQAFGL